MDVAYCDEQNHNWHEWLLKMMLCIEMNLMGWKSWYLKKWCFGLFELCVTNYIPHDRLSKSRQRLPNMPVCLDQWIPCYMCLDYECKVGSYSSEMWTQHIVQTTEYTYHLSCWNFKKPMDNKTKIYMDQETNYISVCTKFEEFILIRETRNAEQCHSYIPLELLLQGTKSKSHPGLPW